MFKIVLICALFALAVAMPNGESGAQVLSRSDEVRADGFDAKLETDNHISETRSGDEHGTIHGQYSWIAPEGVEVKVTYVADENGYQPTGDLLPTPPPIPVEIQRGLEWLAAHPNAEERKSH